MKYIDYEKVANEIMKDLDDFNASQLIKELVEIWNEKFNPKDQWFNRMELKEGCNC